MLQYNVTEKDRISLSSNPNTFTFTLSLSLRRLFNAASLITFLFLSLFNAAGVYAAVGDVWLEPDGITVNTNNTFDLQVHVNSGTQRLGAYQFTITFDKNLVNIDTTEGTDGVEAGPDGFIAAVNTDNSAGSLTVNGFNVSGTGPGSNLSVLVVHFKSMTSTGTADIGLSVSSLTDETGVTIGTPSGQGGSVTVQTPRYNLSVSVNPSGGGTVTGTGINCPGDCSESYDEGTGITLTATPLEGYQFDYWTGCSSTDGNQCSVTMGSDKNVKAYFKTLSQTTEYTLSVSISPSNGGTVTGTGINCPGDCSESYDEEATVALTANAYSGFVFDRWSGCDSADGNQCTMTVNSSKTVKAYFRALSGFPLPSGQDVYRYLPVEEPVENSGELSLWKPFAVGDVPDGKLNLKVKIPEFSGLVDVYLGIYAPQVDPKNLYLLTEDSSLQPHTMGLIPWREATYGAISETIVEVGTDELSNSTYYLYVIVTPAGDAGSFYLWTTYFTIPMLLTP